MGRSVFLSVLLHALFVALAVVGLPTLSRPIVLPPSIDVEVAQAVEPALEPAEAPPPPAMPQREQEPADPTPARPPEPVAAASPPEPEAVEVPVDDTPPPPPQPAPAAAAPPAPAPPSPELPASESAPPPPAPTVVEPEPVEPEIPEPPPPQVAQADPPPAPVAPPPPSRFDDMLRDLSEREPAPPAAVEAETKLEDTIEQLAALEPTPRPVARDTPEDRFARARIYGLIQRQIQANWRRPPALQEVDDMVVSLDFQLQPDGTIHDLHISDAELDRIDRNALLRPLLDSAQAAILRTGKITGLPPEEYALWRRVRLNFRPPR
ncbi:MAG: cell envelope integrity protein TolA [Rhodospirillales bacterium]|nr:cell envelope integrity protein TolA [Rhodospirillales bacterium]